MHQKTILAIDTSETACSVALWHQQQITELIEPLARKHSDCLLPMIRTMLTAKNLSLSQIDCLAFACGPGAFTGLRLGAALVQGFRYALAIPVIRVSTLLAQAYAGYQQLKIPVVLSVLDARMGEIYAGAYEFSTVKFVGHRFLQRLPEQVMVPDELALSWAAPQPWVAVGSGCVHVDAFAVSGKHVLHDENIHCSAAQVLACAVDFHLPMDHQHSATLPLYLRDKVVG